MDEFFSQAFNFPNSGVIVGKDFVSVRGVRVPVAEADCLRLKASLLRPLLLEELQRRALASLEERRQLALGEAQKISEVVELDTRHRRVRCGSNASVR
jgi:hypothetical protein